MSSRRPLVSITLVALVAAACSVAPGASSASPSPSPTAPGIVHPTGPRDLVLRLRYVGGFAPPSVHLQSLPVNTVYGDGTVMMPGAQFEIYPGPALPNLQRATITPAGVQILLEAARDAGLLGPDAFYDLGGIADASTAEFTVNADGRVHVIKAYALMEGGETVQPGTDPAVVEARAKLAAFRAKLGNLEALLGPELGPWAQYEPDAVQLLVRGGAPDDGQGVAQEPIAWPLATPLAGFGTTHPTLFQGERCGVVRDGDLDLLMPLIQKANALTPWTDRGDSYGITVRPLLPDEAGCAFDALG